MVKRELKGSVLGLHMWGWLHFWTTQLNREKQKWIEQQKIPVGGGYLDCYYNKCKRTYMTEKVVIFSNKEKWFDSTFHCCKNSGTFSKNKVSKFHTNRMNCYFVEHIINLR